MGNPGLMCSRRRVAEGDERPIMPERTDRLPMSAKAISRFRQQFKGLADPERAAQGKRYLKSPFKFYGVSVPKVRTVARQFRRENRDISKEALWDLCWALWQGGFHEERALAMFLLEEHRTLLDYSDIPSLERMLRESIN